jgi:hypothetical protein
MAKIIYLCSRKGSPDTTFSQNFKALCHRLTPDNISPRPPLIIQNGGLAAGVFNPCDSLAVHKQSVCMGNLVQPREDWWKPHADVPDGTYALFRGNKDTVEVVSDMLATRTVWYVQTDEQFIASTSQRAILYFLRDFQPNKEVFAWMLSSGTLGYCLSWDSRIRCLEGNSRLVLDRLAWKISVSREPVVFTPSKMPAEKHKDRVRKAIEHDFRNLGLDYGKWGLALSGGLDSRAILLFLKEHKDLRCLTWGLKSSLKDKKSDAVIAQRIAKHFGMGHEFFATDLSDEPFASILNRFLTAGEGRTDDIAGYMDGFKVWKFLYESGYWGILRGDVAFGNRPVSTPGDIYKNVGLFILSDFDNLKPIAQTIKELDQKRPSGLERRNDENLEKWRDRLNAEFEVPFLFAPLNDIKLSFVEVVNPFLTGNIIRLVRELPDDLRTGKNLFKKIVASLNPPIPFAERRAIGFTRDCLKYPDVVEFIAGELRSDHARSLLPGALLDFILENIKSSERNISTKRPLVIRILRPLTPKRLRKWRHARLAKTLLDTNTLGLRACIISRMIRMLSEDAASLSPPA